MPRDDAMMSTLLRCRRVDILCARMRIRQDDAGCARLSRSRRAAKDARRDTRCRFARMPRVDVYDMRVMSRRYICCCACQMLRYHACAHAAVHEDARGVFDSARARMPEF